MNKICNSKTVKLVITGGHHSSALPVIEKIRSSYPDTEIYWIGHRKSMKGDLNDTLEFREITALQIPFFNLKAGKVYKTFDLGRLMKVPLGFFQALYLIAKIKPDVILSFGGYLAVPVVLAGWLFGVPSVTHEQTVIAGYANKLISVFAKKIFISWPQSKTKFPNNKTILTGLPLREEISKVSSDSFSFENQLPTIFITAGKTGSHFMNNLISESLQKMLGFCNVIHQCGDNSVFNDFEKMSSLYESFKSQVSGKYVARKFVFENEIGEVYSKSNLIVSRAGAHTVAEILVLEKPAILIPIPWVSHNEQNENAKLLKEAGLAVILDQKDCTSEIFLAAVQESLKNLSRFLLKDRSLLNLIKSNSAEMIAYETLSITKKI